MSRSEKYRASDLSSRGSDDGHVDRERDRDENGSESGNVIEIGRGKTETESTIERGKEIVTETGKERDM